MRPKEASDLYGGQAGLARVLGVSLQVVNNWHRRKAIPLDWQITLEDMSSGKLKLDRKRRKNGGK